jgi:hypothetical protein
VYSADAKKGNNALVHHPIRLHLCLVNEAKQVPLTPVEIQYQFRKKPNQYPNRKNRNQYPTGTQVLKT